LWELVVRYPEVQSQWGHPQVSNIRKGTDMIMPFGDYFSGKKKWAESTNAGRRSGAGPIKQRCRESVEGGFV